MNHAARSILIVEDHPGLGHDLLLLLGDAGFAPRLASDAASMRQAMSEAMPDLLLMDVGLPDGCGFSLVESLPSPLPCGVIFLSARRELGDRLRGLLKADAWLSKPVDNQELLATIGAVLRRLRPEAADSAPDAGFTLRDWLLVRAGSSMTLTPNERAFLQALQDGRGEPVERERIAHAIGHDPVSYDFHRLEMLVNRLRAKTRDKLGAALPVEAVRGCGYRLSTPL